MNLMAKRVPSLYFYFLICILFFLHRSIFHLSFYSFSFFIIDLSIYFCILFITLICILIFLRSGRGRHLSKNRSTEDDHLYKKSWGSLGFFCFNHVFIAYYSSYLILKFLQIKHLFLHQNIKPNFIMKLNCKKSYSEPIERVFTSLHFHLLY